jgi:hypothetical protein
MSYAPLLTNLTGYEDDVRAFFGLDNTDLTDADIDSTSILGSAELDVLAQVPLAVDIIDTVQLQYLYLALTNMIAFYACSLVRMRVLQTETDGKTTATRFAKAFDKLDPEYFRNMSYKWLARVTPVTYSEPNVDSLGGMSPTIDIVTGQYAGTHVQAVAEGSSGFAYVDLDAVIESGS